MDFEVQYLDSDMRLKARLGPFATMREARARAVFSVLLPNCAVAEVQPDGQYHIAAWVWLDEAYSA